MNRSFIDTQILEKNKYGKSYYANNQTVGKVNTDMDDFVYNRFYRGLYQISNPVIMEREAGYRFVENNCYREKPVFEKTYPEYCFQPACSTIYPCYPKNQPYTCVHRSL